jgi:glycosyltransferase involved in cell wall biosynthesis
VKLLSIVIPAYNEERFLGTLLQRIQNVDLTPIGLAIEIIVVDDCSRDRTSEIARSMPGGIVERHQKHSGKGTAVRTGIARSTGHFLIIQDADLEYEPQDYLPMLNALLSGRGDIVYGSRYLGRGLLGGKYRQQSWAAYLGGRSLSLIALACTGHYVTDTVTALKLFPRQILLSLNLQTTGFELDHEITAKVLARGHRIIEVPIKYFPRSREEGKKIGLRDWFIATRTLWKYGRDRGR